MKHNSGDYKILGLVLLIIRDKLMKLKDYFY